MSRHEFYLRRHFLKVSNDADQAELVAVRFGQSRASSGVRDDAIADTLEENYAADDGRNEETWQSHENSLDTASSQIIEELERRQKALGDLYPFSLDGDVIKHISSNSQVYEFLLCTSLSPNLTTGEYVEFPRKFERIAMLLTANFLGENVNFCHTGSPNEFGRFRDAAEVAIGSSRELVWQPNPDLPEEGPESGDSGVDYILWKDFGCGRAIGQPFFLGQCACGNNWDSKLNDISQRFLRWFAPLKVDPGKVFAIPHVVPESKLRDVAIEAGIVMDRVRLVKALSQASHFQVEDWRDSLSQTIKLVASA
ncbi:hypothetical protein SAMN04488012_1126 [Palleronia salina]|uniref:Uncharacterized protein n=1 Tax=Palleronia salina TaxID=313368 RepID=A0A1M6KHJ5_9RHOB|nr:hypothetical protein [Palleronia salina]SHJ58380.1 hypothetical protein SAMN04488012_1126 [Palleronia salina]